MQAKAAQVVQVYDGALGRSPKPDFGMPLRDCVLEPPGESELGSQGRG